jgi:hypothetical protein
METLQERYEKVTEAEKSYNFQGHAKVKPKNSVTDRYGARDYAMAYTHTIAERIHDMFISEDFGDKQAEGAVFDTIISEVEKFDKKVTTAIKKFK